MNILHITDQRYRSSGVSVFCVELCEAMLRQGARVQIALQHPDYPSPYPVRHEEILTTIEKVLHNRGSFDWDVVHINGVWNWPYHQVARLAKDVGIPVSSWFLDPVGTETQVVKKDDRMASVSEARFAAGESTTCDRSKRG